MSRPPVQVRGGKHGEIAAARRVQVESFEESLASPAVSARSSTRTRARIENDAEGATLVRKTKGPMIPVPVLVALVEAVGGIAHAHLRASADRDRANGERAHERERAQYAREHARAMSEAEQARARAESEAQLERERLASDLERRRIEADLEVQKLRVEVERDKLRLDGERLRFEAEKWRWQHDNAKTPEERRTAAKEADEAERAAGEAEAAAATTAAVIVAIETAQHDIRTGASIEASLLTLAETTEAAADPTHRLR